MLNDTIGGVGYSLIVTAEGKIIAHHGEPVYQKTFTYGENFFDFYSENYNTNDLERVQNDFSQGKSWTAGSSTFPPQIEEESRYLAYAPFGMNDWMICYVIPVSAAQDAYSFIGNYENYFPGRVFSLFVCLLICYIIHISGSRNRELLEPRHTARLSDWALTTRRIQKSKLMPFCRRHSRKCTMRFLSWIWTVSSRSMTSTVMRPAIRRWKLSEVCCSLISGSSQILGRIGGDEFVVFMKHVKNAENASTRAKESS